MAGEREGERRGGRWQSQLGRRCEQSECRSRRMTDEERRGEDSEERREEEERREGRLRMEKVEGHVRVRARSFSRLCFLGDKFTVVRSHKAGPAAHFASRKNKELGRNSKGCFLAQASGHKKPGTGFTQHFGRTSSQQLYYS